MRKHCILGPFLRFSNGPGYEAKDIGIKSGYVKDRNGFFQIKTLKNTKNTLTRQELMNYNSEKEWLCRIILQICYAC